MPYDRYKIPFYHDHTHHGKIPPPTRYEHFFKIRIAQIKKLDSDYKKSLSLYLSQIPLEWKKMTDAEKSNF